VERRFRFDTFEVDLETHRLFKRGARMRLREQSFQVLALLLARAGRVVTREDLRRQLWSSDTFVDFENNLNTAVGRLREALGDSADHPRFIETLPRVGYRFIGSVTEAGAPDASVAPRPAQRLLVLPFVNSSGDPSLDYFSDAVTEEIITELATLAPERLGVIARTTAMHYKGSDPDIAEVAAMLTLDWIVEGAVRRTGDTVTLTAQLIRAGDQTHVLARRFEAPIGDLFDVERAVAKAVGEGIGLPPATPGPGMAEAIADRPLRNPTEDLVAYNNYIQGRYQLNRGLTPENWANVRACLEAALARDPHFALAHDALAEVWWTMGFSAMMRPRDALATGMPHAVRAVENDPSLAEAHAMLAQYWKQLDFNWNEVAREMAIALELNPASPVVRRRRGFTGFMPLGRLDEAIAELEIAVDLDPLGAISRMWLAASLWLDRQYERSIEQARLLLEIEPGNFLSHLTMGMAATAAGRFADAIGALRRSADLSRGNLWVLGWLGLALAESGDAAGARDVLTHLRAMEAKMYVPPTSHAWIHLGLGEVDDFFALMDRAFDVRDHMITPIKSYPFMDVIRDDERYTDLLRKMNLA